MARTPVEAGIRTSIGQTKSPLEIETVHELASWLRHLRRRDARARGDTPWSYRELAARTGWSRTILAEYFAGRVLPPTDRFDALIRLLGATPAEQGALATARDRIDERRHHGGGLHPDPGYRPAAHPSMPRQLPADVPHFVGRDDELRKLDELWQSARAVSAMMVYALTGTAGVGKTALAVHWAHRIRGHYPDGQLHVNLRGFDRAGSAAPPVEVLGAFLDALDVPPHRVPPTLDGRTALYRSITADRRILVLADNARDADHVRPLLPGSTRSLVVTTSRDQLCGLVAADGARALRLKPHPPAESAALLSRRLGPAAVNAEPDAVRLIIDRCAGLALPLSIVAARAAAHPEFPLAVFAAELDGTHSPLDALTGGDAGTDIRAVFYWSYRLLSNDAARMFRLLGRCPAPELSVLAAARLAAVPVAQARSLLTELSRAHLITEHSPGRFTCHGLLRAYAAELAAGLADERAGEFAGDELGRAGEAGQRGPARSTVSEPTPAVASMSYRSGAASQPGGAKT